MQISNVPQNFRSNDPVWVLLAELSLRDFLSDYDRNDRLVAGCLVQTLAELGMPLVCVENVAMLVNEFAKESPERYKQGRLEFPVRLRIICQKKIIKDANAAKTLGPYHTEPGKKHIQFSPDSRVNTTGGWGYFTIERSEYLPPYSSTLRYKYIDLYLYKEGK